MTPTASSAPRTVQPITATALGAARIGPQRELKKAVEGYWSGTLDRPSLENVAAGLRRDERARMAQAGFDSVPTNTFSYYDQMLDTAAMLGALPPRVAVVDDPLDRYFAAARGAEGIRPLEMTKWFDTNYHYLVPEIADDTAFSLHPEAVLSDLAEAVAEGVPARPVVIGPITFLALSKAVPGSASPLDRLDDLTPLYQQLLTLLRAGGADWVQFDEPILVTDLSLAQLEKVTEVYGELCATEDRPALCVATYFGDAGPALHALGATEIDAVAVDLVAGGLESLAASTAFHDRVVLAGVVDGRNVWRTDLDRALAALGTVIGFAGQVAVSTSCSTLHVPYSLESETDLDPTVRQWLAFAQEKFAEVGILAAALRDGRAAVEGEFELRREALVSRRSDPRVKDASVRGRVDAVRSGGASRASAHERANRQKERLGLAALPTTTIGSFPQTARIRNARAAHRSGALSDVDYVGAMQEEIRRVIELQERLGLDVLVHGEPERNDMVQYFAELLEGFVTTASGWVQSYGSRCVRPPILYGDVRRPAPMTVEWASYAQSLTSKPLKGMLTGPVTILAWSFVRDDLPVADVSDQVALAIRQETIDLQGAGISIIQVDEPDLREMLPLRENDRQAYLEWSVNSFRLATSGVSDATQIHTHLCYSEFGTVIDSIARLDADVTSIEAARSHMEILADLDAAGFGNQVGPGVYDIHSPRVPSVEEIVSLLREAVAAMPADRLWVNPDCGLKTRSEEEVEAALAAMVEAAKMIREELG
ncbi:5-methyltetrahydropteroyltriglutamate--homocysteine S-methyltransferase [Dietzia aurantiaca]|uniref:5-methyltetrahydropteroyltriglutamate-- homocysteine S-methyltransferase n=1 Tax=Dietzia aurantiaca TaxID=983873 RepID=UPI001E461998|nr:5-methyltetrahydropteroyltriglutamate--homocysteine S-methyltransferase [Dietzia aurantiaca]MCD2262255.1 5-methyltetrahydropteroyltriglutamate--homocysteine S-methyltransferase [Dietzia aurantiaca]